MRTFKRFLLATCATTALTGACAASAGAVMVGPAGRPFTVSGSFSLTMRPFPFIPIGCTMTGTGAIPPTGPLNPRGSVASRITPSVRCGSTTFTGGPWSVSWTRVGNTIGTVTLPDSGITTYIGGCAFIMPVFQPVTLTGLWNAGNGWLLFIDQQLDLMFTGCGSMTAGPYMLLRGTMSFSSGGRPITVS